MPPCTIYVLGGRKVIKVDIPRAFMQADMEKLVHVKFEGIMDDILVKIDPELYNIYAVIEKGQLVIYTSLNKSLY